LFETIVKFYLTSIYQLLRWNQIFSFDLQASEIFVDSSIIFAKKLNKKILSCEIVEACDFQQKAESK